MAKNGQVHEGGKVGWSFATPTKLFSVDSYDLISMLSNLVMIGPWVSTYRGKAKILKVNVSNICHIDELRRMS